MFLWGCGRLGVSVPAATAGVLLERVHISISARSVPPGSVDGDSFYLDCPGGRAAQATETVAHFDAGDVYMTAWGVRWAALPLAPAAEEALTDRATALASGSDAPSVVLLLSAQATTRANSACLGFRCSRF